MEVALTLSRLPGFDRCCLWSRCHCQGFEGCSMVPTIYPLETLHNSLSLRQVTDFLTAISRSCSASHSGAPPADLLASLMDGQASGDTFLPQQILSSGALPLRSRTDRPPWYSSGPSSTVSSAGPSSPTSVESVPRFVFPEKPPLSTQVSKDKQNGQLSEEGPDGTEDTGWMQDGGTCGEPLKLRNVERSTEEVEPRGGTPPLPEEEEPSGEASLLAREGEKHLCQEAVEDAEQPLRELGVDGGGTGVQMPEIGLGSSGGLAWEEPPLNPFLSIGDTS